MCLIGYYHYENCQHFAFKRRAACRRWQRDQYCMEYEARKLVFSPCPHCSSLAGSFDQFDTDEPIAIPDEFPIHEVLLAPAGTGRPQPSQMQVPTTRSPSRDPSTPEAGPSGTQAGSSGTRAGPSTSRAPATTPQQAESSTAPQARQSPEDDPFHVHFESDEEVQAAARTLGFSPSKSPSQEPGSKRPSNNPSPRPGAQFLAASPDSNHSPRSRRSPAPSPSPTAYYSCVSNLSPPPSPRIDSSVELPESLADVADYLDIYFTQGPEAAEAFSQLANEPTACSLPVEIDEKTMTAARALVQLANKVEPCDLPVETDEDVLMAANALVQLATQLESYSTENESYEEVEMAAEILRELTRVARSTEYLTPSQE